ncbi:hypothetical protein B0H14DRAFT_2802283, partial [Mycena olivaceomarginata]
RTTQRQQQQSGGGLFGAAQPCRRPHPSSGSPARPSSAANASGAPKPAPAFGSSFGLGGQQQQQRQQPNNVVSTLSTSALRPPGAAQPGQGQGQQGQQGGQAADAQTQFTRLTARIEGIAAAWNWAGPGIFYSRVDPAQVGLYGRPPNATDGALWARAIRENPDPGCLVRAIAVGFDDLRQRVDARGTQAGAHQEKLKDGAQNPPRTPRRRADAAHASTAGAREPPAPAPSGRGGGTARVAGGAKGGGGRAREADAGEAGRTVGAGRRVGGSTGGPGGRRGRTVEGRG